MNEHLHEYLRQIFLSLSEIGSSLANSMDDTIGKTLQHLIYNMNISIANAQSNDWQYILVRLGQLDDLPAYGRNEKLELMLGQFGLSDDRARKIIIRCIVANAQLCAAVDKVLDNLVAVYKIIKDKPI
jgi:hypothetical protein